MIEALVDARTLGETLVEFADEFDGVGHLQCGVAAEEFADGDIGRTPQGLPCETGQVLVEEERGTLVGEDDGHTGEVGAVFGHQVCCDVFEETLHVRHPGLGVSLLQSYCYRRTRGSP